MSLNSMISSFDQVLVKIILFLAIHSFAEGANVIPVFRLLQFSSGEASFGSQRTALSLVATSWNGQDTDLSRRILLLNYRQMLDETTREKLLYSTTTRIGGVLLILPSSNQTIDTETLKEWSKIESEMVTRNIHYPFYFAFEDDELRGLLAEAELVPAGSVSEFLSPLRDAYQFVVAAAEASVVPEVTGNNFKGWLTGVRASGKESIPSIAIVSHYDAAAAAPSLAFGADANGSGLVAIFELSRLFSKLYNGYKTQGSYNLLFVVTGAGGGVMNYDGLRQWIASADSRLLDSIEFALCLDSIWSYADETSLYLHVSKIPKEEKYQKFFSLLNETGKISGVEFEFVHKKINISDSQIYWPHELFSRKRVFAATLSHHSAPKPGFESVNVLDRPREMHLLARNIRIIAEGLSKYVYNLSSSQAQVFEGFFGVNDFFLSSWIATLSTFPRFQPFIPKTSSLYTYIEKVMKDHLVDVSVTNFKVETDRKFYASASNFLEMSVYKAKPWTFDVFLFLFIVVYLLTLYVGIKGVSESIANFKYLFAPSSSTSVPKLKKKVK